MCRPERDVSPCFIVFCGTRSTLSKRVLDSNDRNSNNIAHPMHCKLHVAQSSLCRGALVVESSAAVFIGVHPSSIMVQ